MRTAAVVVALKTIVHGYHKQSSHSLARQTWKDQHDWQEKCFGLGWDGRRGIPLGDVLGLAWNEVLIGAAEVR